MTMLDSNFTKVSWNIHPTILPFLTAATVSKSKKKQTLEPYVAPVNHNVLNTEKATNIAHTITGNFFMVTKAKIHRWNTWVWILV